MKIHACLMTQNELTDLRDNVALLLPHVDSITVVDGGSTDLTIPTMRNWSTVESKIRFFVHSWRDNFPEQRNNVLRHAAEIAANGDWLLFVDPDEYLDEPTLAALRQLAEVVPQKRERFQRVAFRCRSVTLRGPVRVHESHDDYWKGLFFRWSTALQYTHNGDKPVHEVLSGANPCYLTGHHPEFPAFWYEHRKQADVIWQRGCRNFAIGGGGQNLGRKNPAYVEFRGILDRLGIHGWHELQRCMIAGNAHNELKDFMIRRRHESGYDGSSEVREVYKYYFRILHPEEEPAEHRGEAIL